MTKLRVMFVNTSDDTTVMITTKSEDSVDYCALGSDTPKLKPEKIVNEHCDKGITGSWHHSLRPGEIYGVATDRQLEIYNPNSSALQIVYANGKDPWPDPPPKSQLLSKIPDYEVRYKKFLMAAAKLTETPPTTCALVLYPDGTIAGRSDDAPPSHVTQTRVNTTTTGASVAANSPAARTVHALLITGYDVNNEDGTVVLNEAQDAIDDIAADLRARFPSTNTIYARSMPTRDQVNSAISTIRNNLAANDLVVVMFAGHGQPANKIKDQEHAWMLSPNELFTVANLANSLAAFPADTDTVVISDCCYGSGFFRERALAEAVHAAGSGAIVKPHGDLSVDDKLRLLRAESENAGDELTMAWGGARGDQPRGNLVSIAAASEWGTVLEHNMEKLATDVVDAARKGKTYAELKAAFIADQASGRTFFVDVHPKSRFNDVVLGTAPSGMPAPTPPDSTR